MKVCPQLKNKKGLLKCGYQEAFERIELHNKIDAEDWVRIFCICEFDKCKYYPTALESSPAGEREG